MKKLMLAVLFLVGITSLSFSQFMIQTNDGLKKIVNPVIVTNSSVEILPVFSRVATFNGGISNLVVNGARLLNAPTGSGDNPENFLYITGAITGVGTSSYSSNTRFISISGTRAAGANTVRGDLQDNGIKISLTNRATANATGYSLRGFDVLAKSRAGGNTTSLYGGYVCAENADDGGAAGDVWGLEATCKNGGVASGTVAALYALNQSPSATGTNYGVLVDLSSEGTAVVKNAGMKIKSTDGSWNYGLDFNATTFAISDMILSSGAKIFTGSAANGNAVYAEVGAKDAVGSIYITTAGAIYIQVANAGADTDWFKVTATDAD